MKEKKLQLSNSIIHIISVLLFSILFSSCGNLDDIEIGTPQDVKIQGFEDNYLNVFTRIPINNPSNYSIKIKEIDLKVYINNRYMGKLIVDEKIRIQRKEDKIYNLPVKIRLTNILGAAFIMMNLNQGQDISLKLKGEVKAQSMFITKSFEIDETTNIKL